EARYFGDKINLFAHRPGMVAVLNREDARTRALAPAAPGRHVWFGDPAGRHNLLNACAALTALEEAGVEVRSLVPALSGFRPLRHRLEPVGDAGGVTFVHDSIATIPEATVAALDALEGRPV